MSGYRWFARDYLAMSYEVVIRCNILICKKVLGLCWLKWQGLGTWKQCIRLLFYPPHTLWYAFKERFSDFEFPSRPGLRQGGVRMYIRMLVITGTPGFAQSVRRRVGWRQKLTHINTRSEDIFLFLGLSPWKTKWKPSDHYRQPPAT